MSDEGNFLLEYVVLSLRTTMLICVVQGDSHLRMTYDALVTRLKGDPEAPIYVGLLKRSDASADRI